MIKQDLDSRLPPKSVRASKVKRFFVPLRLSPKKILPLINTATEVIYAGDIENSIKDGIKGVYSWYMPAPSNIDSQKISKGLHGYFQNIKSASTRDLLIGKRFVSELNHKEFKDQDIQENRGLDPQLMLDVASIAIHFTPPLYTGVARGREGLKQRLIYERSNNIKEYFTMFAANAGVTPHFSINSCIIKYVNIDKLCADLEIESKEDNLENICLALELMAFWAYFPPLNIKKGN